MPAYNPPAPRQPAPSPPSMPAYNPPSPTPQPPTFRR
jgi:hypothetical protein